jgi:hypothetical protein
MNKLITDDSQHKENVLKTLEFVAKELNKQKIDWLLGASGALMVWGVKIVPYDLDIFTSKENVEKLSKVFSGYVTNPLHDFIENGNNYLEFQMKINDVEVEICELDFSSHNLRKIDFNGTLIPVNSLENELQFYKARKGKEKVVVLIEKRLEEINK